jgi:hypothetical protein
VTLHVLIPRVLTIRTEQRRGAVTPKRHPCIRAAVTHVSGRPHFGQGRATIVGRASATIRTREDHGKFAAAHLVAAADDHVRQASHAPDARRLRTEQERGLGQLGMPASFRIVNVMVPLWLPATFGIDGVRAIGLEPHAFVSRETRASSGQRRRKRIVVLLDLKPRRFDTVGSARASDVPRLP